MSGTPPISNETSVETPTPVVSYTTAPARDRWAHRRIEPRPFALLWILYLLGAALISFGATGAILQPSSDTYRYATLFLFTLAAIGVSIFWPMLRLSQSCPTSPPRAVLLDLVVMLPPLHCVVWPQLLDWMARWSLPLVATIAAAFTAWSFLIGALLALALGTHPNPLDARSPGLLPRSDRRSLWMVAFLVLAFLGPAVSLSWPGDRSFELGLLASPIAFVSAILHRANELPDATLRSRTTFWSVAAPSGIATTAWLLVLLRARPHPKQIPHKVAGLAIPPQDA